jgi:hypothetical protein
MRSDTHSVTIEASVEAVRRFVADPANLPRWAIGFAQAVRREQQGWVVTTAQGDMPVEITTDEVSAVVDFHLQPAPGVRVTAYSRVVSAGAGSVYTFTQVRAPGMPDEVFDGQVQALRHELDVLKRTAERELVGG